MLFFFIIFFLLLSALFSGTEIAFLSANKLWIELKRKKGLRRGTILSRFYEKPSSFIGSLLVGNNIALVVFTILMNIPLTAFLKSRLSIQNDGFILLFNNIVITIVILLFGEFLPKTLFRLYADKVLFALAVPLRILKAMLAMPTWIMTKLSNFILVIIFKNPIEEVEDAFTRLDLENFIKSTRTQADDEIDTELFEKALNLREVRVKDCMVPRPEIESIDVNESVSVLLSQFQHTNHSRIIVYDDDIDNTLGYVHHQQMIKQPSSIRKIIMETPFVPETMHVRDLLNQFIKNRLNIACVVDEFGGTAGIITLEDMVEEIFGEIEDEHDQEYYVEEKVSENEYIFSGRLEISNLLEKYPELEFPEGDYSTLSGYLVMTTGNIPSEGDEILLNGYRFILEKVSETKIEVVRVFREQNDPEET